MYKYKLIYTFFRKIFTKILNILFSHLLWNMYFKEVIKKNYLNLYLYDCTVL